MKVDEPEQHIYSDWSQGCDGLTNNKFATFKLKNTSDAAAALGFA